MNPATERRLLQGAVALACLVPLAAGGEGIWRSADFVHAAQPLPRDLDSHFRYLSGLLLGIGIVFAASIPRIERAGAIFRALGTLVVIGGLARLFSLFAVGPPRGAHGFALAMELAVVPLLVFWQARVARRCGGARMS